MRPEPPDADHERADGGAAAPDTDTEAATSPPAVTVEIPGRGALEMERRCAVLRMYQHLRREGAARRADFRPVVGALDRLGCASWESFWSNLIAAHQPLRQLPGVAHHPDEPPEWRFDLDPEAALDAHEHVDSRDEATPDPSAMLETAWPVATCPRCGAGAIAASADDPGGAAIRPCG